MPHRLSLERTSGRHASGLSRQPPLQMELYGINPGAAYIPRVGPGTLLQPRAYSCRRKSQMSLSRIPVFRRMWGDPTLLIDFSRHNNEQRCSFQYSPNPDYIGSEDREFSHSKCQLSCSTVETYNDVLFSLCGRLRSFPLHSSLSSPTASHPTVRPDTEAFATVLFTEVEESRPYLS